MRGGLLASVRYAGHWFWIDDEDYPSKRAFSFLLLLSALVESRRPAAGTSARDPRWVILRVRQ